MAKGQPFYYIEETHGVGWDVRMDYGQGSIRMERCPTRDMAVNLLNQYNAKLLANNGFMGPDKPKAPATGYQTIDLTKLCRVLVIDEAGNRYERSVSPVTNQRFDVEMAVQDDGRTLKVFINPDRKVTVTGM